MTANAVAVVVGRRERLIGLLLGLARTAYEVLSALEGAVSVSDRDLEAAGDELDAIGNAGLRRRLTEFYVAEVVRLCDLLELMSDDERKRVRAVYVREALAVIRPSRNFDWVLKSRRPLPANRPRRTRRVVSRRRTRAGPASGSDDSDPASRTVVRPLGVPEGRRA